MSDAAAEVKVAVAFAVSRMGDDAVRAEVAAEIARLAGSDAGADRSVAALMLGDCESGQCDRSNGTGHAARRP